MSASEQTDDRETRALYEEIRTSTLAPWTKEVESLRQKCRSLHLVILFHHVHSPLALSLDPLWMHTTYSLITSFRTHLKGVKEVTRFRQFLTSEEGWYRQLIGRICKAFGLKRLVQDGLDIVDIRVKDEGIEEREKVALVHKALICLGDIERYKAQYPKSDDFSRSRAYYDAARIVNADDGAAYNQLAVISTYIGDDFSCIYYYFRALAIKVPFKGAQDILGRFLTKCGAKEEGWRRDICLAVASAYAGRQADLAIVQALPGLLANRTLSSESIVKIAAITIGTHYQCRMNGIGEEPALDLVLGVMGAMLSVAANEVETSTSNAIADDEELPISPTLRRLLPGLRIYSKWLKLHIDYLAHAETFWTLYYRFIESIARAFPLAQLPMCEGQLEEDRDMRGYLPISRGLAGGVYNGHPDVLMRVADLEVDATLILQSQTVSHASIGADGKTDTASTSTEDDPVNLAMRSSQDEIGVASLSIDDAITPYGEGIWAMTREDSRSGGGQRRDSANLERVRALWGQPPIQLENGYGLDSRWRFGT
jgi:hypothetical protein